MDRFVGAGEQGLVFDWTAEPGCMVGEHIHLDTVETFQIVEGQLAFKVGGRLRLAQTGDEVRVDIGVRHAIRNRSKQNALARVSYSPRSDSMYREIG